MTKEERDQFAKDNFNLIYTFIDTYHLRPREDELIDILYIAYTKAIDIYDPKKGTFATIAFEYMKREFFRQLYLEKMPKRDSHNFKFVPLDSTLTTDGDTLVSEVIADPGVDVEDDVINNIYSKDTFANVVDAVNNGKVGKKSLLTKGQQRVFHLRFIEGHPRKEVAEIMGVSKQRVADLESNMIRRLSWWFKRHDNYTTLVKEEDKKEDKDITDLFGLSDETDKSNIK